jgi:hypothetical protein
MILDMKLYTVTNGHGMMSNNRKNVHILYIILSHHKNIQNGAWHVFYRFFTIRPLTVMLNTPMFGLLHT